MICLCVLLSCFGQTVNQRGHWEGNEVVIAVKHFNPMMDLNYSVPIGFDADWIHALLRESGNVEPIRWKRCNTVAEALKAVETGEAHLAISGITITPKREKQVDFSHQYMRSGLLIAVPDKRSTMPLMEVILDPEIWHSLVLLFILYAVIGTAFLLVESRSETRTVRTLRDAVSLAHETTSTIGHGAIYPTTWPGLILSIVAFFVGVIVVGNVVSTMSSIRTVEHIDSTINSPEDLRGKKVATMRGTNSVDVLKDDYGSRVEECDSMQSCFDMLDSGKVDAVCHDAPAIRSYLKSPIKTEHDRKFATVGSLFDVCYYGIAFQEGSEFVEMFNRSILGLQHKTGPGSYNDIHRKWLGE